MKKRSFLLLVEDSLDDIELTKIAFNEAHFPYEVVSVADGAEALDFLFATGKFSNRDKADAPALILLDLNLPKVNGWEILKKLKADPILKNSRVVVLTSSNEPRDRALVGKLGADLYIQKQVDFGNFGTVVRQIEGLLQK